MTLSQEQKVILYEQGSYCFKVPPVYTGNWNSAAWIKWIDYSGKWLINKRGEAV